MGGSLVLCLPLQLQMSKDYSKGYSKTQRGKSLVESSRNSQRADSKTLQSCFSITALIRFFKKSLISSMNSNLVRPNLSLSLLLVVLDLKLSHAACPSSPHLQHVYSSKCVFVHPKSINLVHIKGIIFEDIYVPRGTVKKYGRGHNLLSKRFKMLQRQWLLEK